LTFVIKLSLCPHVCQRGKGNEFFFHGIGMPVKKSCKYNKFSDKGQPLKLQGINNHVVPVLMHWQILLNLLPLINFVE